MRPWIGWRLALVGLMVAYVWLMVWGFFKSISEWLPGLLLLVPLSWALWLCARVIRSSFDADNERVQIRGLRDATLLWSDIASIEPSHSGFVFTLRDGHRFVAFATAKSGFTFRPPRFDKQLLADLRARLD
jgi:hypothetical protein